MPKSFPLFLLFIENPPSLFLFVPVALDGRHQFLPVAAVHQVLLHGGAQGGPVVVGHDGRCVKGFAVMHLLVNIPAQGVRGLIGIVGKGRDEITGLHQHLLPDLAVNQPVEKCLPRGLLLRGGDLSVQHDLFGWGSLNLLVYKIARIIVHKIGQEAIYVALLGACLGLVGPGPVPVEPESGLSVHKVDGHLVVIRAQGVLYGHIVLFERVEHVEEVRHSVVAVQVELTGLDGLNGLLRALGSAVVGLIQVLQLMGPQGPVLFRHGHWPLNSVCRQFIQQRDKFIQGGNGLRVKFFSQRGLDHRLIVDDPAPLHTQREAVHRSVQLGQVALGLLRPGLAGQVHRFFLCQRQHICGVQNCQRGRVSGVIEADHLCVRRIAVRYRHNLHMDARLFLKLFGDFFQSHLNLRLGVQKRNAGPLEGGVILEGIR